MNDWALPYEAPISLDATRMLGSRPMRSTLWTFGAVMGTVPVVVLGVMVWVLTSLPEMRNDEMATVSSTLLFWTLAPTVVWLLVCLTLRADWAHRPAEHWIGAWLRHRRLPRKLDGGSLWQHHTQVVSVPRGVVEVIGTANLRMADADTLSSHIKRLGVFFNGLRFPIQVVVRAWPGADGLIERRWFVAFTAPTDAVLQTNTEAIVNGLSRAGLRGHPLNSDLYDTLQKCWTVTPRRNAPGPSVIRRERSHVVVDGEYVRGFVLGKMPRIVDANWLAPIIDGDLVSDLGCWMDPTDNADEREYLGGRMVGWQAAQILNANSGAGPNPDIDDQISDAKRTRLLLGRRELRVFRVTLCFVVRGKTLAEMTEREALLRAQVREQVGDEALIPLDLEHDRVPLMVVPLGEPSIEHPLRTVTPAVARGYIFSNSSTNMVDGIDVGTSVGSKRPNRINLFGMANPLMVVLGASGAGKGFWVKVFLWRLLHAYSWDDLVGVTIIQAEKDEYSALADALGPDRAVVMRIATLAKLPELVYPWNGLFRVCRDLVVYDLTLLPSADRGPAIAFLLEAVEKTAAWVRRPKHGIVVIDELGIVLESEVAAIAIETAYRRFRSIPRTENPHEVNRRGMIGVSQRPSDLLRHPRGKVFADLALTHVYFRQKSTELKNVAAALNLTPDEVRFLDEQCDEGTGLLVADRARVGFHLYPSALEKEFATT